MLPYILLAIGVILTIVGLIGLVSLALLPLKRLKKIVYDREDDFYIYSTAAGRKLYKHNLEQLIYIYCASLVVGIICFFLGMYLGTEKYGETKWPFSLVNQSEEKKWDKVTSDGKFKASDGNKYTYFIVINGDSYIYKNEIEMTLDDIKEKLNEVDNKNAIALVDNYAILKYYKELKSMLQSNGYKVYEE